MIRQVATEAQLKDERETGGTGLGLSTAERDVRFHGGSAQTENALGGGLLVRLTLPLSSNSTVPPNA